MGTAIFEKLLIGIAQQFRFAALSKHHLHEHRFAGVVLVTVNDPARTGDAVPLIQDLLDPFAFGGFEENRQLPLEYEEDLFDLMRMSGISLARGHFHDAEREAALRDDAGLRAAIGVSDELIAR